MKPGRYGARINGRRGNGQQVGIFSAAYNSFVPNGIYGDYAQAQDVSAAQKLRKSKATSMANRAAKRKPTLPTFKCLETSND